MKRILSIAAALAFSLSSGAMAQTDQTATNPATDHTAAYSVAASSVGRWLYDLRGNIVGSVRSVTDDGRTAVIMVGAYFQPGSHEARVPASALSVVNGKVTLRGETIEALNTPPQR